MTMSFGQQTLGQQTLGQQTLGQQVSLYHVDEMSIGQIVLDEKTRSQKKKQKPGTTLQNFSVFNLSLCMIS